MINEEHVKYSVRFGWSILKRTPGIRKVNADVELLRRWTDRVTAT